MQPDRYAQNSRIYRSYTKWLRLPPGFGRSVAQAAIILATYGQVVRAGR